MTSDMVLNNLRQLIVGDSDNIGYDKIAYIEGDSVQFLFELNSENIIEDVWME